METAGVPSSGGVGVETAGVPSSGGGGGWRQLESLAQTPGTWHPTDACRTVFSNHDHATG